MLGIQICMKYSPCLWHQNWVKKADVPTPTGIPTLSLTLLSLLALTSLPRGHHFPWDLLEEAASPKAQHHPAQKFSRCLTCHCPVPLPVPFSPPQNTQLWIPCHTLYLHPSLSQSTMATMDHGPSILDTFSLSQHLCTGFSLGLECPSYRQPHGPRPEGRWYLYYENKDSGG